MLRRIASSYLTSYLPLMWRRGSMFYLSS
uniref:Uncharacterized protein n=1 Tax=Arundo donax TaxID=35708 RepID=A0A0A8YS63_ARUDO